MSSALVIPQTLPITALRQAHAGETCWIIGKGPSLLRLKREQIGPGPVITLNQAIEYVEPLDLRNPLYSMQKDHDETDWIVPKTASLIVHAPESGEALKDYWPRYEFDNPRDFQIPWYTISVVSAIHIAHLMGCAEICLVCCDASAIGDYRTVIGLPPLDPNCYPTQRGKIEAALHDLGLPGGWLIP